MGLLQVQERDDTHERVAVEQGLLLLTCVGRRY